eukprot:scpid60636/ scgid10713/ 
MLDYNECSKDALFVCYRNGHFAPILPDSSCSGIPLIRHNGLSLPISYLLEQEDSQTALERYVSLAVVSPFVAKCQAELSLPPVIQAVVDSYVNKVTMMRSAALATPTSRNNKEKASVELDSGSPSDKFPVVGRRIIDVRYLASQLRNGCTMCGHHLHLQNCVDEVKHGLASRFELLCLRCSYATVVSTSTKHRRKGVSRGPGIYDVNTKVAAGKHVPLFFC